MKDLIKEYEDKLSDVEETIELTSDNGSQNDISKMARLKTKASCYKTFIEKLVKYQTTIAWDNQVKKRTNDCINLEMSFNGNTFIGVQEYNKDFNIHQSEMICDTYPEWEKKIYKLQAELMIRKA